MSRRSVFAVPVRLNRRTLDAINLSLASVVQHARGVFACVYGRDIGADV